jgi:FkbM family methyltransferase
MNQSDQHAFNDATSGEYEKHYQIQPDDIVIDVGAHVGFFSEYACNKGAYVIAFEPHPDNFRELNKRLLRHRALAINKGCFAWNGAKVLHECPTNSGAHSFFKHGQCSDVNYEVGVVYLGDWLDMLKIKPNFIKIDTEGSEAEILQTLMAKRIRCPMAIETHDANLYDLCRVIALSNGMKWLPETNHVGVCYLMP